MERLVDLHVHLDGSLSLETVKELAARQGIEIQNDDILIKKLQVSKDCSACDVALKARDAEAHVGRVAERRQHECCDADDNTGQNDEQVFFFHVLFPPI